MSYINDAELHRSQEVNFDKQHLTNGNNMARQDSNPYYYTDRDHSNNGFKWEGETYQDQIKECNIKLSNDWKQQLSDLHNHRMRGNVSRKIGEDHLIKKDFDHIKNEKIFDVFGVKRNHWAQTQRVTQSQILPKLNPSQYTNNNNNEKLRNYELNSVMTESMEGQVPQRLSNKFIKFNDSVEQLASETN